MKFVFCEGGDDLAIVTAVAAAIAWQIFESKRSLGRTDCAVF
jgi:hypothetical protein